ncbi:alginate export family protein [Sulfuriroseicoccus oceanibius]|uniref:Alginate export family protein n=1 Tax=Sulfuriroseicoccus oceanibius TaxID=2707525 RepID=A0A6B3LD44_9BACT|nr:alginate export family protein [Sulfuriroseicoccus oceanibius]QQL44860.1 alginate export family protein [Sulfuriroseicoccus oceanibius]
MKTSIKTTAALALTLTAATAGAPVPPESAPAPDNSAPKGLTMERLGLVSSDAHPFLRDTRILAEGRLRYEYGDIDGLESSDAITFRSRLGLETGELAGFSALVEGESTYKLGGDYAEFPGFNNGRTVIADPDNYELNRAQLHYAHESYGALTVGRQYINLDDQRFVGAVGWRQNSQTFDAVTVNLTALEHVTVSYSWIDRVNRIFGDKSPSANLKRWKSDSHLIHVATDSMPGGKLVGFAYLLDFESAPASSSNTYGLTYSGQTDTALAGSQSWHYLASSAYQEDAGNNPDSYGAWYFRGETGLNWAKVTSGIGAEVLGSDNGDAAFQTPLGTNHKFNGFADAFLTTPDSGLRDFYCWVGGTCPLKVNHKLIFHYFQGDHGRGHIGNELDYVATKQLYPGISVTGKLAYLDGQNTQPDTFRGSIQLDYKF